jgi:hypothetical protein
MKNKIKAKFRPAGDVFSGCVVDAFASVPQSQMKALSSQNWQT